jgi:hypothetical protein
MKGKSYGPLFSRIPLEENRTIKKAKEVFESGSEKQLWKCSGFR